MRSSLRSFLVLCIFCLLCATVLVWLMEPGGRPYVWPLRIGGPMLMVLLLWHILRADWQEDLLPNHLAAVPGVMFEADGLCVKFVVGVLEESPGVATAALFFQNRYANPCEARMRVRPAAGSLRLFRPKVPELDLEIYCPGGGFGVARVAYPIRRKYQGRRARYEVTADVRYPAERGKMLRFKSGVALAGSPWFGIMYLAHPVQFKLRLPRGVAETVPGIPETRVEILDDPDLATGAFPVIVGEGQ